ncbi:hypothetical protein B0H14DRAFT_956755 [Mycena olivaceomarginata]|nr:hypothetical protein B0H14DRAFT_956755 [Mycena olivaceomarginata]
MGLLPLPSPVPRPRPLPVSSAPRCRRFSKEEIESWGAANYAPRRDANESRAEYEERLTLITRRAPLSDACRKLSIKAPRAANLDRLRQELAKYWFAQPSSHSAATSRAQVPSALPFFQDPGDCPQLLSSSRAAAPVSSLLVESFVGPFHYSTSPFQMMHRDHRGQKNTTQTAAAQHRASTRKCDAEHRRRTRVLRSSPDLILQSLL